MNPAIDVSIEGAFVALLEGLIALLIYGLFVLFEFALVRSQVTNLRGSSVRDRFGQKSALALIQDLNDSLLAAKIGQSISTLILGITGFRGALILLSYVALPLQTELAATFAIIIALTFLLTTHLLIGEFFAKTIAIRNPEGILCSLAVPAYIFVRSLRLFAVILRSIASSILKLFGVDLPSAAERIHTSGELALLISHRSEQGSLDQEEEEMLYGVIQLSDTVAREVMTPRTDLEAIPVNASFDEALGTVLRSGYSRFPVIGSGVDDVLGIILARDLLHYIPKLRGQEMVRFNVHRIMREAYFIPGTKPIDDLLNEFKLRKLHMAIVLDEHGGVDGVVTLEDLLEEIVGDIQDESDLQNTEEIVEEENGMIVADGSVLVSDLNDEYDLDIPEGEYDTIGGFIFSVLGRVPTNGDEIAIVSDGSILINGIGSNGSSLESTVLPSILLRVEAVDGNRVDRIRLQIAQNDTENEPQNSAQRGD